MADTKNAPSQPKPYNSPTLDEIRQKIDELDNRIHDTLMERAELVLKVGEEKRKNNIQIVQPAREARMIRRLLGRHKGVLPEMAVVRIWRELVGAVSLLQTGLKVIVAMPESQHEYWDLARDYFGSSLPMSKANSAIAAISALKEEKTTFAVVPCPLLEDDQPWWTWLGNPQDPMQIIMSLPHGNDPANPTPDHRALVVSKAGFDDSGADNSYLMIQCDASISRARLIDTAKKAGITALGLSSKRNASPSVPALHLMEVEDYMAAPNDKRIAEFLKLLEDVGANIICAGGYPVPPSYSRTVKSPDAEENILKAAAE